LRGNGHTGNLAGIAASRGINEENQVRVTAGFGQLRGKLVDADDLNRWIVKNGLKLPGYMPTEAIVSTQRISITDDQSSC
jgi:hypothetical protein